MADRTSRARRMSVPLVTAVLAVPLGTALTQSAFAADKYWDINGATSGAGGATPTGTWDTTTANWSTSSAGTAAGTTWASGDNAFFSAGTNATGSFTVTVSGTQTASSILFEEGTVTLTGGALTTGTTSTNNLTFNVGTSAATITSLVTGAGNLIKEGTGTLVLNDGSGSNTGGLNNWTGSSNYINAGTLSVITTYYLGNSPTAPKADYLTISNGAKLLITGVGSGFTAQQVNKGITLGASGGVIDIATTTAADSAIFLGTINGTTLTKTGAGEMRVQGINTFQKLVVDQGFYRLGNAGIETGLGAVPTAPLADQITLQNGAWLGSSNSLQFVANRGIVLGTGGGGLDTSGGTITVAGVISGAGGLNVGTYNSANSGTAGFVILTGNNTYTGGTTIIKGTGLQIGNNGTTGNILGDVVDNSQLFFSRSDTYTFGGNISGTGKVLNAGSGTVVLTGTNTNANGYNSTNGLLRFGAASALAGSGRNITASGNGAVAFGYTSIDQSYVDRFVTTSTGGIAISAADAATDLDFTAVPGLHLGASTGTVTYTGNVTFPTSTVRLGGGAGTLVYPAAITGGGNVDIIGMPGGTVILTGSNTYTGTTTINGGALQISDDAFLGAVPASPTDNIFIGSTAALRVSSSITLDPNRTIVIGPASGSGTATLDITGSSVTFGGTIRSNTGTGILAKSGTGKLVLSGVNTFTGNVLVSAGNLTITSPDSLGSGTKTITLSGTGQLHLDGSAGDITLPSTYSISSTGLTLWNDAGNNTIAGNITAASGSGDTTVTSNGGSLTLTGNIAPSTTARNLVLTGTSNGAVTGIIRDGSTTNKLVSVTKSGTGTWTLSGANTYTGTTIVNAGTLKLGADNTLPSTTAVTVAAGATLDTDGHAASVASLAGTGATGTVLLSGDLTLNGAANTSFAGSVTGTGTLSKSGTSTQTLGSVVASAVSVSAGRLVLNGAAGSKITTLTVSAAPLQINSKLVLPATTVTDATTLVVAGRGSGTWNGTSGITTVADGRHGIAVVTPADLGVVSFGGISLTGSETLLASAYYGDLNLDGRLNADDFALMDRGFAKGLTGWINGDLNYDNTVNQDDYFLLDSTYIASGVPHEAELALLAQREAQFGDAYVQSLLAAVPEPTTLSLLAFGALPLLSRRRRTAR